MIKEKTIEKTVFNPPIRYLIDEKRFELDVLLSNESSQEFLLRLSLDEQTVRLMARELPVIEETIH